MDIFDKKNMCTPVAYPNPVYFVSIIIIIIIIIIMYTFSALSTMPKAHHMGLFKNKKYNQFKVKII